MTFLHFAEAGAGIAVAVFLVAMSLLGAALIWLAALGWMRSRNG